MVGSSLVILSGNELTDVLRLLFCANLPSSTITPLTNGDPNPPPTPPPVLLITVPEIDPDPLSLGLVDLMTNVLNESSSTSAGKRLRSGNGTCWGGGLGFLTERGGAPKVRFTRTVPEKETE